MGHFYEDITGVGRDKHEAQRAAIDDFLWENGNRHSVREVLNPVLVKKVPPKKMVKERRYGKTFLVQIEDRTAPQSDWLEEWRFTLHTHA